MEMAKRWKWSVAVSTLVASWLSATALGQPELWLQYQSGVDESRPYRWLELTTNAPPEIKLPKLNSVPRFARWTTPMDNSGGRWLCLDRSTKAGLYDRLYFDTKGNGRLDDASPVSAQQQRSASVAEMGPVPVVFKGEDGPITYHLAVHYYRLSDDDERLLVESAGSYQGTVKIGDQTRRIELIDGNVNGTFNDTGLSESACDRVIIDGDRSKQRCLGRLLEVGGQLFQVEVARDGAFLKIEKAQAVALGKVRLPDTIAEFTALGPNGHFVRRPANGELTLPVGDYRVSGWRIDRNDKLGSGWTLEGYNFPDLANFTVSAETPVVLDIGEPVRTALQVAETSGEMQFSLRFQGKLGESIQITQGGERPPGPRLTLTSQDGSYSRTNSFEFG